MTRRLIGFVTLAVILSAVFVCLGIWQLDRRVERRVLNDRTRAQLERPPVPMITLLPDTTAVQRRATIAGTPDFAHEIILTGRSRNGSPGVHILTPVRLAGRDTAVLVNRGWVYSPDAATVDLNRWREARPSFSGFTQRLSDAAPARTPPRGRAVRHLSQAAVARLLPYPVHALYLVARDSAAGDSVPARLDPPRLSDGPHLSYAIQWFCFATIALVGAAAVVRRDRSAPHGGAHLAKEDHRPG